MKRKICLWCPLIAILLCLGMISGISDYLDTELNPPKIIESIINFIWIIILIMSAQVAYLIIDPIIKSRKKR